METADDKFIHGARKLVERLDALLLTFFYSMTNYLRRWNISSSVLVNIFLCLLFIFQIGQILFLIMAGESIDAVLALSIPTWLLVLYFRAKITRGKGKVLHVDGIRIFAIIFACFEVFFFFFRLIVGFYAAQAAASMSYWHFLGEISYTCAWVVFPSVLYLISVSMPDQKFLNENRESFK
jgi:hypothetical protein